MRSLFFIMFMHVYIVAVNEAAAQDLQMGYMPSVEDGDAPSLSILPSRPLTELHVELEVGGQHLVYDFGSVPAGTETVIRWDRDPAVTAATARIRAVFTDGFVADYSVPMSYSYGSLLDVDLDTVEINLEAGQISVEVTDRVTHAELVAYGARKTVLDRQLIPIDAGPGRVEIPWEGDPEKVVLLDIIVHNDSAMAAFTYSPWYLEIPHQDVRFETNQSDILSEEAWKLKQTLKELREVQDLYGEMIDIKLYIGGCTDTVGEASGNRDLSGRRARSIARWLQSNGYGGAIYTYGFGEAWPAILTGDGVDEAANRRAVYMVGTRPPPSGSGVPRVGWRKF